MAGIRRMFCAFLGLGLGSCSWAQFNSNIVQNGSAEIFTLLNPNDPTSTADFPGWIRIGNVFRSSYAQIPVNPGPDSILRGENYFLGGNEALTRLVQTIDLAFAESAIAAGNAQIHFCGWLGGFLEQDDSAELIVRFLGVGGVQLGLSKIGPVTAAQRNLQTSMLFRDRTITIPLTTSSLEIELRFERFTGSWSNGSADLAALRAINGSIASAQNYAVLSGQQIGGTLASFDRSDDDRFQIINDESVPDAKLNITAHYNKIVAPSTIEITLEHQASRTDLTLFARAFNYSTNSWVNAFSETTKLVDTTSTFTLATQPQQFINATGDQQVELTWIPFQDLSGVDGWSESVDLLRCIAHI